MAVVLTITGCASVTKDLARTLRYSDGQPVGVKNIDYQELQTRPKGEACTWNFLFVLPIFGDGSIITAANNGNVNNIELIGETGIWYFPMNKNCTVVYGQKAGQGSNINITPPNQPVPLRSEADKNKTRFFTGE
jgi:hypothetical protein